jgi:hypothetical protein
MRRHLPWLIALPVMAAGSVGAILIGLHLAVVALAATLFLRSADADPRAAAEPAT